MAKQNKEKESLIRFSIPSKIKEHEISTSLKVEGKEVFKFTKDQLYLYGKKIEVNDPEVIQGFKTWMKKWGHINS
jgi:hypothetical protein